MNVKIHNSKKNLQIHQHYNAKSPNFHYSDIKFASQNSPISNNNAAANVFHFQNENGQEIRPSHNVVQSSSPFSSEKSNSSTDLLQSPIYTSHSTIDLKMSQIIDPKIYSNDELIRVYNQQKETSLEFTNTNLCDSLKTIQSLNECDNKIAVVRKLNMVDACDISEGLKDLKCNESVESLEEKAVHEKSEKQIKFENLQFKSCNNIETEKFSQKLNMIQNSKIHLDVHQNVQDKIDMACQTDVSQESYNGSTLNNPETSKSTCTLSSSHDHSFNNDIDCDKLSKDLISQLSPSDKLHSILGISVYLK